MKKDTLITPREMALIIGVAAGIVACLFWRSAKTDAEYRNPVLRSNSPDPSVIKANDGYYYLYGTEDMRSQILRNVPIHRSANLVDWEYAGTAFTDSTRPDFEPQGGIWAPDINYIGGRYVMYYSMSVWGGETTCGIGTAVADLPQGPFTDAKMLFRSNEIGVQNSIDPNYFEDKDGRKYLFWGSWHGIWGIELTDDGLAIKEGAAKRQIAGTAYEAAYLHMRGDYYYLFASIGSCCEGLNSTYTIVAGRSKSLWGPYLNRAGESMMDNRHDIALIGNYAFVGAGHNSEIVQDAEGNDWVFYHGYMRADNKGREVFLDKVEWSEDGCPLINDGSPSKASPAPAAP